MVNLRNPGGDNGKFIIEFSYANVMDMYGNVIEDQKVIRDANKDFVDGVEADNTFEIGEISYKIVGNKIIKVSDGSEVDTIVNNQFEVNGRRYEIYEENLIEETMHLLNY